MVLILLAYYAADQIVGQRFLAAETPGEARLSVWWHTLSSCGVFAGLGAAGLILFVFYQTHPQRMRPEWVLGALSEYLPIATGEGVPIPSANQRWTRRSVLAGARRADSRSHDWHVTDQSQRPRRSGVWRGAD